MYAAVWQVRKDVHTEVHMQLFSGFGGEDRDVEMSSHAMGSDAMPLHRRYTGTGTKD